MGDLAPLLRRGLVAEARAALVRGATVLAAADLAALLPSTAAAGVVWSHPHAAWAMACVLEQYADAPETPVAFGENASVGAHAVFGPRVIVGARVTIGPSSVIGEPGFGWADGPGGVRKRIPQLGGVVIEDDVAIGALVTVDAGTLGPTILRRGVKLDAHVHVGHNCEIGEGTVVAAQSGFAGSVKVGKGVLVGGQVGIADHVSVGDGARIAAKSGVIGDVPRGAIVAGYPAVPRVRWLRGLASLYRKTASPSE